MKRFRQYKKVQLFMSNVLTQVHFTSILNGNNVCKGHTECDSIIMDQAYVLATPQLAASSTEANLIHQAAIGKIASEQMMKLMTLGLTGKEAEEQIIAGFLK